jgi:hypothetical protein
MSNKPFRRILFETDHAHLIDIGFPDEIECPVANRGEELEEFVGPSIVQFD